MYGIQHPFSVLVTHVLSYGFAQPDGEGGTTWVCKPANRLSLLHLTDCFAAVQVSGTSTHGDPMAAVAAALKGLAAGTAAAARAAALSGAATGVTRECSR